MLSKCFCEFNFDFVIVRNFNSQKVAILFDSIPDLNSPNAKMYLL